MAKKKRTESNLDWSQRRDSNPRPSDYKSEALPAMLRWRKQADACSIHECNGKTILDNLFRKLWQNGY